MARKRRPGDAEPATERELSYEEYTGAGARPTGTGGRRNVAPGAVEAEPEDYDEQNRRNVGGEGGGGIQTGTYEDDYGPGARGHRQPEFQTEPRPEDEGNVLRRKTKSGESSDDFPTGSWSAQKTTARLKEVKSRKMRARSATGRGVGVRKPAAKKSSATRSSKGKTTTKKPARSKRSR